jgi:hypothetical protein
MWGKAHQRNAVEATSSGSEADLDRAAEALAIKAYQLGLDADELADRLRTAFRALPEQS